MADVTSLWKGRESDAFLKIWGLKNEKQGDMRGDMMPCRKTSSKVSGQEGIKDQHYHYCHGKKRWVTSVISAKLIVTRLSVLSSQRHYFTINFCWASGICYLLPEVEIQTLLPTACWHWSVQGTHNVVRYWMEQHFTQRRNRAGSASVVGIVLPWPLDPPWRPTQAVGLHAVLCHKTPSSLHRGQT